VTTNRADELRKDAVRIALTGGLSRQQFAEDLGVGKSTLNKWVTVHRDTGTHPFLMGCDRRTYAAIFSFMADVMPSMPMLSRSLL
jgi:transposase-like protein